MVSMAPDYSRAPSANHPGKWSGSEPKRAEQNLNICDCSCGILWGTMLVRAAILVGLAVAVAGLWYLFFRRYNRRQGKQAVAWIDSALAGAGETVAVRWLGPALLEVKLRLQAGPFHQPAITVALLARHLPIRWLRQWWRREPSTITWQADLDMPPAFNLEVGRHCWSGRTRRRLLRERREWTFRPVTSLILTSRRGAPPEVVSMMNVLLSSRECQMLSVAFRRTSPHFSAVIPLDCISPEEHAGAVVFDTLRELAAGASASRM